MISLQRDQTLLIGANTSHVHPQSHSFHISELIRLPKGSISTVERPLSYYSNRLLSLLIAYDPFKIRTSDLLRDADFSVEKSFGFKILHYPYRIGCYQITRRNNKLRFGFHYYFVRDIFHTIPISNVMFPCCV